MATKAQVKKIERLVNEVTTAYNTQSKLEAITYKNSKETKLYNDSLDIVSKKDEELNRYIIEIKLTEEEFYSIKSLICLLDGVYFEEYINNY